MKAVWNDIVIAESNETVVIDGTHYFPPQAVKFQYLQPSDLRTSCSWRGMACYYNVVSDGEISEDSAWYYPKPNDGAHDIAGFVAFWNDVNIRN